MKNKFLLDLSSKTINKKLIIGFPFSGAVAQVFNGFKPYLPENVNLYAIQYPGRGHNITEPLLYDINSMLKILYLPVLETLQLYDVVYFYGHSMGALVAYALLKKFQQDNISLGKCILNIGACPSPNLIGVKKHIHSLPDDIFWQRIKEYGGTPPDILDDQEFKNLFLPILKADFSIYENYIDQPRNNQPLTIPINAFAGSKDKVVLVEDFTQWKMETTGKFNQMIVDEDHFFLSNQAKFILQTMIKN